LPDTSCHSLLQGLPSCTPQVWPSVAAISSRPWRSRSLGLTPRRPSGRAEESGDADIAADVFQKLDVNRDDRIDRSELVGMASDWADGSAMQWIAKCADKAATVFWIAWRSWGNSSAASWQRTSSSSCASMGARCRRRRRRRSRRRTSWRTSSAR